jgi:hypothetical protein
MVGAIQPKFENAIASTPSAWFDKLTMREVECCKVNHQRLSHPSIQALPSTHLPHGEFLHREPVERRTTHMEVLPSFTLHSALVSLLATLECQGLGV